MRNFPTNLESAAALFDKIRGAEARGFILLANNTRLEYFDNERGREYGVRFHRTIIVRYMRDGAIALDSGGYSDSPTTRERIHSSLPNGISCGQCGGIPYLALRKAGANWERIVWQDSVTLHPIDGSSYRIEAEAELEDADEAARVRRNALARDRYKARRDGTPLEIARQRSGYGSYQYTPRRQYSAAPRAAMIMPSDSFDPISVDFLIIINGDRASIIPKSKRAAASLSTEKRLVKIGESFPVSRETAVQAAAVAVENSLEVIVEDA